MATEHKQQNNGYGVIWDVDGTLVDTAELHFDAWVKLASDLRRDFTRADFAATFGKRNPEIIGTLFQPGLDEEQVADLGDKKEIYYREEAQHGVALLPGTQALLEGLHSEGFKQALGSSAPRQNLELILASTKSAGLFEAVVGSEDTSRGKPDPQVFLIAAEKIGVPPEKCLVFEDAVAGVEAAKAAGMKCIAVTFVGHHSRESLIAAGADLVVPSLELVSIGTVKELLGLSV